MGEGGEPACGAVGRRPPEGGSPARAGGACADPGNAPQPGAPRGASSAPSSPRRRHPMRASQVRALATGERPSGTEGRKRQPSNHRADDRGYQEMYVIVLHAEVQEPERVVRGRCQRPADRGEDFASAQGRHRAGRTQRDVDRKARIVDGATPMRNGGPVGLRLASGSLAGPAPRLQCQHALPHLEWALISMVANLYQEREGESLWGCCEGAAGRGAWNRGDEAGRSLNLVQRGGCADGEMAIIAGEGGGVVRCRSLLAEPEPASAPRGPRASKKVAAAAPDSAPPARRPSTSPSSPAP